MPRTSDALLTCVVGKSEKLGVLDRVGEVARLGRWVSGDPFIYTL